MQTQPSKASPSNCGFVTPLEGGDPDLIGSPYTLGSQGQQTTGKLFRGAIRDDFYYVLDLGPSYTVPSAPLAWTSIFQVFDVVLLSQPGDTWTGPYAGDPDLSLAHLDILGVPAYGVLTYPMSIVPSAVPSAHNLGFFFTGNSGGQSNLFVSLYSLDIRTLEWTAMGPEQRVLIPSTGDRTVVFGATVDSVHKYALVFSTRQSAPSADWSCEVLAGWVPPPAPPTPSNSQPVVFDKGSVFDLWAFGQLLLKILWIIELLEQLDVSAEDRLKSQSDTSLVQRID